MGRYKLSAIDAADIHDIIIAHGSHEFKRAYADKILERKDAEEGEKKFLTNRWEGTDFNKQLWQALCKKFKMEKIGNELGLKYLYDRSIISHNCDKFHVMELTRLVAALPYEIVNEFDGELPKKPRIQIHKKHEIEGVFKKYTKKSESEFPQR